ncbi:hypothetical protein ACMX25_04040 [Caballeronia sp. 15715]|uniref:hypothetical protein n=1 Tax=Caballeronia sp. 15715 TaxID=3391030 RepID=UPI0039E5FD49
MERSNRKQEAQTYCLPDLLRYHFKRPVDEAFACWPHRCSGQPHAATIEALALPLLGSGKSLTLLDQFDAGKYSTNVAVRDVLRNRKALGLDEHGVKLLEIAKNFYHNHSHFSRLTVATVIAFEEVGLYVGASFDEAKFDQYDSEVASWTTSSSTAAQRQLSWAVSGG